MQLPSVTDPHRYRGLYIFDFGPSCAVGYTLDEVVTLLEQEAYQSGVVYKIVRVQPDGTFELRGVARAQFDLESGMFFYRADLGVAEADFDELRERADGPGFPCRAKLHLADRGPDAGDTRYVTALIYPAEVEEEIGRWMLDVGYAGGDLCDGGPSHVSNYYAEDAVILRRHQLWNTTETSSRSAEEVLGSVRRAVQR